MIAVRTLSSKINDYKIVSQLNHPTYNHCFETSWLLLKHSLDWPDIRQTSVRKSANNSQAVINKISMHVLWCIYTLGMNMMVSRLLLYGET